MATVRLLNAALDEGESGIILRGCLDMSSIGCILTDNYQREVLPGASNVRLVEAFKNPQSSVPDIVLGMRGTRTNDRAGVWTLKDDVYVIDGLQRMSAAIKVLAEGTKPRLGAVVHFNTTKDWEIEQFRKLNADRVKVAPSVLLRNQGEYFEVVATLQRLCEKDPDFVLHRKVCWQQRPRKAHLINAVTLLKSIGAVHSFYPGGLSARVDELVRGCQKIFDTVGKITFRKNTRSFFDLIEESWGLSTIQEAAAAPQIRGAFLRTFGRILADHEDFWRGDLLFVSASLRKKIGQFKILDPIVQQLSNSGGSAQQLLYKMIVDHINWGKRTQHLTDRSRSTRKKEVTDNDGRNDAA